jgi:hypothetical protein
MLKPNGYDEAKESGFASVDLGGHYAVIKRVEERTSKTGKPMIAVGIDFMAPDRQAGFFANVFENDDRPDKKWPHKAMSYVMVQDYQNPGITSRNFKTFCTSFEKSNNCEIQWGGNNWAGQFTGKKIGVVYGEVENEYNGEFSMREQIRWFCSWDSVKTAKVPKPKYLEDAPSAGSTTQTASTTPAFDDSTVPF